MWGDHTPEVGSSELEEEYERYSDPSVWRRTDIIERDGVRFFLAWTETMAGVEAMTEVLVKICPALRAFLLSAHSIQRMGEGPMGRIEIWLEAKICVSARKAGRPQGCFMLRLDPGSFQQETVSTHIISPEGEEIGVCVFEITGNY